MTAAEAVRAAQATSTATGTAAAAAAPTVTTGPAADRPQLRGTPATGTVHIVTTSATVRSLAAPQRTYRGYSAIFDAATHRLLYACLGTGCPA
jgi:hypothetical protein